MKVLYDARWIRVDDRFDGVSRYSLELARALAARGDLQVAWLVCDTRQLDKLPAGEHLLATDPNNPLLELGTPRRINRAGYTLVYSPFFVMGTIGKRYRLVLTIHDMIYFHYRTPPQWLPWYARVAWRLFHLTYWPMRWQLNRADAVATVSQTALDELTAARATRRPMSVVSNAVGEQFTPISERSDVSNEVLYMGSFTPYKNVECLIAAAALLPDITLHLCSNIPPTRRDELVQFIASHNVTDRVVLHDGMSDDEYTALLSQVRCSLSASRIEGFGLPIIEAQRAGVPMAVSDTPIFREVGGDGVLYFDPDDPQSAADCIARLGDPAARTDLIAAGHANAARYTWPASAEQAARIMAQF